MLEATVKKDNYVAVVTHAQLQTDWMLNERRNLSQIEAMDCLISKSQEGLRRLRAS